MEAYRLMVCGRSLVIRSWKYCPRRSTSSAKQSMVLKPGQDRTVQLKKPQTGHFYGLFNMKNRSMKKKTVNRIDRGRTDWFCEPWLVQTIHTGPLFQALNYTFLDSLPCFFSLYGVIWTLELDHSLKQEILASLSQSRNPR